MFTINLTGLRGLQRERPSPSIHTPGVWGRNRQSRTEQHQYKACIDTNHALYRLEYRSNKK